MVRWVRAPWDGSVSQRLVVPYLLAPALLQQEVDPMEVSVSRLSKPRLNNTVKSVLKVSECLSGQKYRSHMAPNFSPAETHSSSSSMA